LYYRNDRDPRIAADLNATEAAYQRFAKKWRSKPFTADATILAQALREYESLIGMPEASRPGRYYSLRLALNVHDTVAQKQQSLLAQRLRPLRDQILFFTLALGALPPKKQKALLREPVLAHSRYFLSRVFAEAKHHLTEAEEKIINLKSRQSYGLWTEMVEKIVSARTISWRGETIALPEAFERIDTLASKDKPKLWQHIITELEQISEVAEHEFNAIITDVRTEDVVRGYPKPYSATALSYEDSEATIENLVAAVSEKGFRLSQRFYKLKAAWHGVPSLHYSQKYDSIGPDTTIPFAQAVDICRDVFYAVHKAYGALFDTMLARGQIDVFPKRGKQGGAFMSDQTGNPIQVMLNHTSTFKSLETLAHEMGHAIHANRSAQNTPFYDGHSISTAETASTLFENLVFDAVYAQADPHAQVVLLHDRLTRDIATVQRQIAFFNAELEIHQRVATEGALTREEYRALMYRHLRAYLGPAVALTPEDGYTFVHIPHLRYGFYVYTYAFGLLMSTIMANRFKADRGFAESIDRFLSAGSSAGVADIFMSIGIDITHKTVFTDALREQEQRITQFARLVKAHTKK
jgi:oligoendopeptidase F